MDSLDNIIVNESRARTITVFSAGSLVNINIENFKTNPLVFLKRYPQLKRHTNATKAQMLLIAKTNKRALTVTARKAEKEAIAKKEAAQSKAKKKVVVEESKDDVVSEKVLK